MDPHRLDLFRGDHFPLGPHQRRDFFNIRSGRMNHRQEYLDDDRGIRQRDRPRRLCVQPLPCGNLCLRRLLLDTDVQVKLLHIDASDLARRHEVMERVINAEPETILKLRMRMARRVSVDQIDDGIPQRAITGKEHSRVRPKAICVERWGSRQRVVLARVTVTAEVSHSIEHSEDSPSGDVERASQLVDPGDETVAEEALEFLDMGTTV